MAPRGLLGLGIDTIDFSGTELRDILLLYTDSHSLPNLVHCTQGKDRTGMCRAVHEMWRTSTQTCRLDMRLGLDDLGNPRRGH
jgi:hypothetical protein